MLDEVVALPSWMIFSIGLINLMTGTYVWVLICQRQIKHGSQLGCGYWTDLGPALQILSCKGFLLFGNLVSLPSIFEGKVIYTTFGGGFDLFF